MATPFPRRKGRSAGGRAVLHREVDHDFARKPLDRRAQRLVGDTVGHAQPGAGAKHLPAGEGFALDAAGEFLNIDPKADERLRDVADDSGPFGPENGEMQRARRYSPFTTKIYC